MPRSPGRILALGLVLTVVACWPAARLAIEADPAALMPRGSAAAADYTVFLDHFGGLEQVFVLVLAGPEAGEADLVAAADRLAELLEQSPEVAHARSGLEQEDLDFMRRYVAPRAPLLLGGDWRRSVEERIEPEAIRRRVQRIQRGALAVPGSTRSLLLASDPFGFSEELAALRARSDGLPVDPFTGAFLSPDGAAALIVVTPTRTEIDPEGGRALSEELSAAFATVREETEPELEFLAAGGPLYAAEDERLIKRDVRVSLIGSAIGCVALLLLAFGGVRLPLAIAAGVGFGLVWTAAALRLTVGAVTAAGMGFSAVLIGLGLDYGIHGAVRYRQRRLDGDAPDEALATAIRSSGAGVLTSALTTAGAFAVLAAAHFRPLRELGVMVALGIVCILLTSMAIGAPLVWLWGSGATAEGRIWRWLGVAVDRVTGFAARRALLCAAALGLATAIAAWGLTRLSVDPDLRSFRSTEHSAFEAERRLTESFGLGLDTATIVVSDAGLEGALGKAERVRQLLLESGDTAMTVSSPADWLSGSGPVRKRLAELGELPLATAIRDFESELAAGGLNPRYFEPGLDALREIAAGRDPGEAPPGAWPDWLRELVRPSEGAVYAAVRVRLAEGRWQDGPPADLVRAVRDGVGGQVASATLVGSELRRLAGADLRALAGLALLAVALVVLVSFRGHAGHSLLALTPVLLGALWSLGLWGALGRPLDLASLAVLPIVLGIGLDDGLHALHSLRRQPHSGLVVAVREVGRAMLLTTATTCIAFGSLAATTVPGLRNAGLLVSVGVLGCLLATLVALPALESLTRSAPRAPGDPRRQSESG